jgi:hypothetical protein
MVTTTERMRCVTCRSAYARGGGGSGTIGLSIGDVRAFIEKEEPIEGATTEIARERTATGPMSETNAPFVESFVLRHEHDDFAFGFAGCIGHSCPSPCEQVHDCSAARAVIAAQSDTGVSVSTETWNKSHPPTIRARCCRTPRIAAQLSTTGRRTKKRGLTKA